MLKIRFFRVGKKKRPSFKIIVTDKKNPPQGGRFVDEVGFWNPLTKDKNLDKEKIQKWLSQGAKPSSAVYNLLVKEGILVGAKIPVHSKEKKKEEIGEEAKAEEAKKEESSQEEAEKAKTEEKKEEKMEGKEEKGSEEEKAEVKPSREGQKEEEKTEKEEKKEESQKKEEIKQEEGGEKREGEKTG